MRVLERVNSRCDEYSSECCIERRRRSRRLRDFAFALTCATIEGDHHVIFSPWSSRIKQCVVNKKMRTMTSFQAKKLFSITLLCTSPGDRISKSVHLGERKNASHATDSFDNTAWRMLSLQKAWLKSPTFVSMRRAPNCLTRRRPLPWSQRLPSLPTLLPQTPLVPFPGYRDFL